MWRDRSGSVFGPRRVLAVTVPKRWCFSYIYTNQCFFSSVFNSSYINWNIRGHRSFQNVTRILIYNAFQEELSSPGSKTFKSNETKSTNKQRFPQSLKYELYTRLKRNKYSGKCVREQSAPVMMVPISRKAHRKRFPARVLNESIISPDRS